MDAGGIEKKEIFLWEISFQKVIWFCCFYCVIGIDRGDQTVFVCCFLDSVGITNIIRDACV